MPRDERRQHGGREAFRSIPRGGRGGGGGGGDVLGYGGREDETNREADTEDVDDE